MTPFRRAGDAGGAADAHPLARFPDWRSLERDLAAAVPAAVASGEELTVAVLELEGAQPVSRRRRRSSGTADDTGLLRLLVSVRPCFKDMAVYRVGPRSFAVVGRGVGAPSMGQCVLLAAATAPCRFGWGTASLRRAGGAAPWVPDILVRLAQADLYVRRRELAGVHRGAARRRLAGVGSVAAASVLLAGAAVALGSSPGTAPTTHQAEHVAAPRAPSAPPAPPTSIPPSTAVPAPGATAQSRPPAGPGPMPTADEVLAASPMSQSPTPQVPEAQSAPPTPASHSWAPQWSAPQWSAAPKGTAPGTTTPPPPAHGESAVVGSGGRLRFALGHPANGGAPARQGWPRAGPGPYSL